MSDGVVEAETVCSFSLRAPDFSSSCSGVVGCCSVSSRNGRPFADVTLLTTTSLLGVVASISARSERELAESARLGVGTVCGPAFEIALENKYRTLRDLSGRRPSIRRLGGDDFVSLGPPPTLKVAPSTRADWFSRLISSLTPGHASSKHVTSPTSHSALSMSQVCPFLLGPSHPNSEFNSLFHNANRTRTVTCLTRGLGFSRAPEWRVRTRSSDARRRVEALARRSAPRPPDG